MPRGESSLLLQLIGIGRGVEIMHHFGFQAAQLQQGKRCA